MTKLLLIAMLIYGCDEEPDLSLYDGAITMCSTAPLGTQYSVGRRGFMPMCTRYSKSCIDACIFSESNFTLRCYDNCLLSQPEDCVSCIRQNIRYCWGLSCPLRYDAFYCCMVNNCEGNLYNNDCARTSCNDERSRLYDCPATCQSFTSECFP